MGMDPRALEAAVVAAWDFSDLAASREIMARATETAETDLAERLVWLTQVARADGLLGDVEGARDSLTKVERLVDGVPAGDGRHHVRARLAIERGRLLNTGGDPSAATPHFAVALEEARLARLDGLAVDALHMRAISVGHVDGTDASRAWNEQAMDLAESSPDPAAQRWRGSLLNNMGWDHHDAGRYAEALGCFERALAVRRSEDDAGATLVAGWAVARALRSLGRYDEALARQQGLAATSAGAEDGFVHEEVGECLLALGRHKEAAAAFSRAHELLSGDPWLVEHEPERLARIASLAGAQ